jgi:hypothetical protein
VLTSRGRVSGSACSSSRPLPPSANDPNLQGGCRLRAAVPRERRARARPHRAAHRRPRAGPRHPSRAWSSG